MNIFYLDEDPIKCAQMHNDKHLVKMILETAQLLSTAHRVLDGKKTVVSRKTRSGKMRKRTVFVLPNPKENRILYEATHINHPSARWVRKSKYNYEWLYLLFCGLCVEYTHRYGKTHSCETKLIRILRKSPKYIITSKFTQPPQAMPEHHQCDDSVEAYRKYYMTDKLYLAKWSKRDKPSWFNV